MAALRMTWRLASGVARAPAWSATRTAPTLHIPPAAVPVRFVRSSAAAAAKDYYDTLGVGREASKAEIKKKYYQLAKKYHPDANKDDPKAAEKFSQVQEAYEVLSDESKRSAYNQFGKEGVDMANEGFDRACCPAICQRHALAQLHPLTLLTPAQHPNSVVAFPLALLRISCGSSSSRRQAGGVLVAARLAVAAQTCKWSSHCPSWMPCTAPLAA